MDTSSLKKYAIQARRDFIEAVSLRANKIGVYKDRIESYREEGDLLILGAEAFPKEVKRSFEELRTKVQQDGFDHTVDTVAYTWFNRLMALRYMEVLDYLDFRVLSSSSDHPHPDILQRADHVSFAGSFNFSVVSKFLDDGNKDEELYRYLLIAQCNQLYRSMPFLFEQVSELSELLLPDNLLATDSIVRNLVNGIDETLWLEGVEIIGWLYQFYISEKKDEVIGKVVKSEDIPAATQLFTPNWIVKYLVQNSVGAYWLGTYPNSPLKEKLEYYIEPAEQTPEVQTELEKITPKEIDPETITVLDPASGSGHILVEAYDLLKEIYLERGYRPKDIPRLILSKNLFGLDIDERAAQMAGFSLLMKARADDKDILSSSENLNLNICEIKSSKGLNFKQVAEMILDGKKIPLLPSDELFPDESPQLALQTVVKDTAAIKEFCEFLEIFEEAKTLGSLIQIPEGIRLMLPGLRDLVQERYRNGNLFQRGYAEKILPLLRQAEILSGQYDCVVANPPYMGGKYQVPILRKYLKDNYSGFEKDIFSAFIVRNEKFAKLGGQLGFMSPFVWMFISSYENLRTHLLTNLSITSLVQLEYSGFDGATVPICTFTLRNTKTTAYNGSYIRLSDFRGSENQGPKTLEAIQDPECGWMFHCKQSSFSAIPGSPIAYWVSKRTRQIFIEGKPLSNIAESIQGMITGDNSTFLRLWFELPRKRIGIGLEQMRDLDISKQYWIPYNKGGSARKWFGNNEFVLNWKNEGRDLVRARTQNTHLYFKPGVTWTFISSSFLCARYFGAGFVWDVAGSSAFSNSDYSNEFILGLICSRVGKHLMDAMNPTLNFQVENILAIPISNRMNTDKQKIDILIRKLIEIAKADWDSLETSWEFQSLPLLKDSTNHSNLADANKRYISHCQDQIKLCQEFEAENNRRFISGYSLEAELFPDVPEQEITLRCPNQSENIQSLISYAFGCMVGRYSLDEPGLIYANSGNIGFDPSRYVTFPADTDGILPILDFPWFEDDTTTRFFDFLQVVWGDSTFDENIKFVANSLQPKKGDSSDDTIRRYLSESFYTDHLKTYKKRPIYWLFSSGKERAFQCLVYLHRYNENTLSQMRTDYVIPLHSKFRTEEEKLEKDIISATSPSEKTKYEKQLAIIRKKQVELNGFDEELQSYANKRITLDLDDGVKENYGKFGNLLYGVKDIVGKKKNKK